VADRVAIEQLVEKALGAFGHIDTLLNVAGVNRRMPAERLSEADYDFILDINLKGPFLLSLVVGKVMLARGRGSNQINVVSLNNTDPQGRDALRHEQGSWRMTRSLAWGPRGIRVNIARFRPHRFDQAVVATEDAGVNAANAPLKRIGVPADMVGTAIFLASGVGVHDGAGALRGRRLLGRTGWPIEFRAQ
jgi:NAD(P)-dependent dehydrogenase (short-subunit alcohol dehydrogenase family)